MALAACASTAEAQSRVALTIDTSLADRALSLTCSGQLVDESAVRASPLVQAQIAHNSNLRRAATMDAYVAALRALSACQAPEEDPFNVAAILAEPDAYRAKVAAVAAQRDALAAQVEGMLAPYMSAGHNFSGSAVIAVPYFSCGGFAYDAYFFVDIACMNAGLEGDLDSLRLLVAHETFHAIQAETYFDTVDDFGGVTGRDTAIELMFASLLWEGMAEYVASTAPLAESQGGGRITQIFRRFAEDNRNRRRANFASLSLLIGYVAESSDAEARARVENAYNMAFTGTYEQFAYFSGAQMAADIEQAWGREALVCVTRLPPEQFALAHDAVASDPQLRLAPGAIEAARALATARGGAGFEGCRGH